MLNSVSHNQIHHTLHAYQSTSTDATSASSSDEKGTQAISLDRVSLRSESSFAVSYSSDMRMSAGDEAKYGMLQNLVANLLKEQGIDTKIAIGDTEIDLAALTPEEAQDTRCRRRVSWCGTDI